MYETTWPSGSCLSCADAAPGTIMAIAQAAAVTPAASRLRTCVTRMGPPPLVWFLPRYVKAIRSGWAAAARTAESHTPLGPGEGSRCPGGQALRRLGVGGVKRLNRQLRQRELGRGPEVCRGAEKAQLPRLGGDPQRHRDHAGIVVDLVRPPGPGVAAELLMEREQCRVAGRQRLLAQ